MERRQERKVTLETLITNRVNQRELLLKLLRSSASRLAGNGTINQMESLLNDEVSFALAPKSN